MRHAGVLLIGLIVLCSGCGAKADIPAAPLILKLPDCPSPGVPVLPTFDGTAPFDSPENTARLLERDDILRAYIDGLEATIRCFRRQREEHEPK